MTDQLALIDALNHKFAIPGVAEVIPGNGGLAKVRITSELATAEVYLHSAQVTSWRPRNAEEALFLSEQSRWEDGRAIRGGIPICFPWFRGKSDDPKAPAHGVVRTRAWQLDSIKAEEDGPVIVAFSTESDDSTRRWWPFEFRLTLRISVGESLDLELSTHNTGDKPFSFEEALHTYFRVSNAQTVRVQGLNGVAYLDNTDSNRERVQSGDVIFSGPTDNAYRNTHSPLGLIDPGLRRILRTEKENSATTVVWNPWQQGAAALADLGDDEWRSMACVEAANILGAAVTLAPGATHTLRATLSVAPE